MKIKSASAITQDGGIKIAVHAAPGMGKTMLAATIPRSIVILTEKTGAASLTPTNIGKVFGKDAAATNIPVVEAYTIEDFEEAITTLESDSRFDTIFIDSVSEVSKMLLRKAMPNFKNKMQAYGAMAEQIDMFIRSLNNSPKNIVYLFHSVSHVSYDEEGDPSGTVMIPGFEGQKMKTDFPFLNGDIFCIINDFDEAGEETRYLRTRQGDSKFYAKNRSGILEELETPHIGKIFSKINAAAAAATTPASKKTKKPSTK